MNQFRTLLRSLLGLGSCCGLLLTVGCGGRGTLALALQDENPAVRAEGAHRAGETRDRSTVALLVERLEDPNADVRFFAAGALRRITGKTFGYRHFDDVATRTEGVKRWRHWLAQQASGEGKP